MTRDTRLKTFKEGTCPASRPVSEPAPGNPEAEAEAFLSDAAAGAFPSGAGTGVPQVRQPASGSPARPPSSDSPAGHEAATSRTAFAAAAASADVPPPARAPLRDAEFQGPPLPLDSPHLDGFPATFAALEGLLVHLKGRGFSDVVLTSGSCAAARVDGVWRRCSARALRTGEIASILDAASGNAAASAMALGGTDLDFGFEVEESRLSRLRFRGNAAGVATGWSTGLTLTLRLIPGAPPSLEELGCEPELAQSLFPENGLVLATGVMGSGKSTFLAAVMRGIAERGGRHVCTYEAPVEFDLSLVKGACPPVEQSEIPRHMPDFLKAVRNLTRRAADAVLVGEARDPETLRGVLEAAELGLACYTTAHTRSVSGAPMRILNAFGPAESRGLAASLFSSLRCVVQQRLFPSPRGGRHAVREWLALDQPMRDELQASDPAGVPALMEEMVEAGGMPLLRAVERDVSGGLLWPSALASVKAERGRS